MEGNRRPFFKQRSNPQFKRKGSAKRGKWNGSGSEQTSLSIKASDTVYRLLCHSKKIGSVIGKGGGIVKALREETQAKITVAEAVPGSEERVIIIYSPSIQVPRKQVTDIEEEEPGLEKADDPMELHCAAQDALLRVHDKIVAEDIGGTDNEADSTIVITARLLVANNLVGCLLGKKGDVIQRLRSETGASIRVLPPEQLPTCAMSTDELVQISGNPAVARKALYEVSTLLHQNPRKEKPPLAFPTPHRGLDFRPPGPPMRQVPPPPNPMWPERNSFDRGGPEMPWMMPEHSRYGASGFDVGPPLHGGEASSEFSMKILCSHARIGGVIGKGGSIVKQLERDSGANITVGDVTEGSDERVIRVSSLEAMWNPTSRTIDAILVLQDKASEQSKDGNVTTRLLIPSSKVGCIIGEGGSIINEMRRRTKADIRVFSKEDKPKCAGSDDELVQVSGAYGVAKDALTEIASRYRERCLRDPEPIAPGPAFGPRGNVPGGRAPPSGMMRGGHSGRYEPFKRSGRGYEPHGYPATPSDPGYPDTNSTMEGKMPGNALGPVMGPGGSNSSDMGLTRPKHHDPYAGSLGYEGELHAPLQHQTPPQEVYPPPYHAPPVQNNHPQQSQYPTDYNYPPQQGTYSDISSSQPLYPPASNPQQQPPYQDYYQNSGNQQQDYYYQSAGAQSSYQY